MVIQELGSGASKQGAGPRAAGLSEGEHNKVAICELTAADVVRHPLVQRLVEAYADRDATKLAPAVKRRFDNQCSEPEP